MALQGYMAALMLVIRRDLIIGLEMASTPVGQLLKTPQEMVEKDMKCKYNLFLITILQNKAKNSWKESMEEDMDTTVTEHITICS